MEYISRFFENIRNGLFISAVITIAILVLSFGMVWISQYVINFKRIRQCGLGIFRAFAISVKYTYVFRFEISDYGLTVEALLKKELTGELIIPEGIAAIYKNAFCKCRADSVRLPQSLRYIGENAFGECAFSRLTIPNAVEFIGEKAFQRCSKLEIVEMSFVPKFNIPAFTECGKLRTVVIGGQKRELSNLGGSGLNFLVYYIAAMDAAADGDEAALECVKGNAFKMLELFVSQGSISHTEKLLALPFTLSAKELDNAIETAIKNSRHEIYVMLAEYKRQKLKYDDGSAAERFEL